MGPLFVIMCLYPWLNLQGDGGEESVFVTAFMSLGIKKAALMLNFIVILAFYRLVVAEYSPMEECFTIWH